MNHDHDDGTCPVCGFHLPFIPWLGRSASHMDCTCCGTEFGYDDDAAFDDPVPALRDAHFLLRERWVADGMPWTGSRRPPPGWDPVQQLADLEAGRSDPTFGGHSATATDPHFDGHATCPVCGYQLDFVPWIGISPSHRTCPSCGTRFGFHDMLSRGDPQLLAVEHERLRGRWLEHGAGWSSPTILPPPRWDPQRQLLNLDAQ